MVKVTEITAEETYPIRKEVLRKNIELPSQFSGDLDPDTIHLGLFSNQELVSVVSFMKTDNELFNKEQYQLRGMATLEKFQGKGYGLILLTNSEKILKKRSINVVWCNARIAALNFYQKQGFKIIGEEFHIPQIGGHFVMKKKLTV